ncbi:hypothetical protein BDQ94DRAFT_137737 [Aspergillus welwitschiae]|uniref:Uncharacterized protein n=1 Tax=Aspergillus welwitschiae TaxID=1341132 RepID=A0A3F3QDK6_9EURO|nr:hypothetical protein BDQ94DRAFT_137737 [Aspergillus welwitschiae]RDH37227.1 hypothetical protein BDQ94DRAFT_137737 [Aspergillus welwitschiae]
MPESRITSPQIRHCHTTRLMIVQVCIPISVYFSLIQLPYPKPRGRTNQHNLHLYDENFFHEPVY